MSLLTHKELLHMTSHSVINEYVSREVPIDVDPPASYESIGLVAWDEDAR